MSRTMSANVFPGMAHHRVARVSPGIIAPKREFGFSFLRRFLCGRTFALWDARFRFRSDPMSTQPLPSTTLPQPPRLLDLVLESVSGANIYLLPAGGEPRWRGEALARAAIS